MIDIERIRERIRNFAPHLTESEVKHAAEVTAIRVGYVLRLDGVDIFSPLWNQLSRDIVECEVVLSKYGLV
jgi:hypothetical protein